jgi:hypothetical protein
MYHAAATALPVAEIVLYCLRNASRPVDLVLTRRTRLLLIGLAKIWRYLQGFTRNFGAHVLVFGGSRRALFLTHAAPVASHAGHYSRLDFYRQRGQVWSTNQVLERLDDSDTPHS